MRNLQPMKHLRSSSLIGGLLLLGVSTLDLSSACHPSDEAVAARATVLRAAEARPAAVAERPSPLKPVELTWRTLEDVIFTDVYMESLESYYWKPTFGSEVEAMEGKEVHITGYIIPVDLDEDFYVLSRYPYANCFFCGGAGPESVIDLRFEGGSDRVYQTDERLTFRGTLRLNADDIYQMNYILDGAVEYTL